MDITTDAAIGYMILAAKTLGINKKIIQALESQMKQVMDTVTEETAEITYIDFI